MDLIALYQQNGIQLLVYNMPTQPKYNVILKLADGKKYDFEQYVDLAYEDYENQPGRCRFSIPSNDLKLALVTNDEQFIQILITRNGTLCWQGFVACITDDIQSTTFYGLSLLECLKWYRVGFNTAYTSKKIGTEIISPIWDAIDARSGAILGDIIKKGTIEDPYQSGTTTAKTVTRTVFDEDFFTLCLQMIAEARADSPNGAFIQNTVMAISLSETAPTFSFLRNVGADKPLKIFELDSDISDFVYTKDFRYIKNDIKGLAVAEGPEVLNSTQTDATSQSSYYLREISQVTGATSQTELDEETKDILETSKNPEGSWYLSFSSGLVPYDGYVMGDNVKVRISKGRVDVDDYFRVIGMEITVNNDGSEVVHPILEEVRS
jgi:hypothetical protein